MALIPAERIGRANLLIRGQKVMIDTDLAALYSVETKQLVRAVKRNIDQLCRKHSPALWAGRNELQASRVSLAFGHRPETGRLSFLQSQHRPISA